jgi:hypothetical protein
LPLLPPLALRLQHSPLVQAILPATEPGIGTNTT